MGTVPKAPPPPPLPAKHTIPPELLEDDEFTEKRHQKELQFRIVGAIENNNLQLTQELIDKGVNTNATILLVKTPLIHALEQGTGSLDVIRALVNAEGTDVNLGETTPWGKKPLHYVAETGSLELAKLIVEGAKSDACDINVCDNGHATPLHYAAWFGQKELVWYFLDHGADLHAQDDSGRTALHRACEIKNLPVASILVDSGSSVNCADNYQWTPIFHAAFFGHNDVLKFLLAHGADVNATDAAGNTLLHIVCYNIFSEIHSKKYPELVSLKTSFDFYHRKRKIPTEEFQELILMELTDRLLYDNCWMFDVVKMLINTGIDPKVYPTDYMYCSEMSVLAKTRAYLILAGAMLPFDDPLILADDKDGKVWRSNWFKVQKNEQLSLRRQCRYAIRRVLAHTRDIDSAIGALEIPEKLKNLLKLDDDFEEFLTITDDGGPYVEELQSRENLDEWLE